MIKTKQKPKVIVGLSGGVDSAVSAALLKEKGYEVAGAFMRFWKDGATRENGCCSAESEATARLLAKKLDMPFYVFDVRDEFKNKVVDCFLSELAAGRTPNPCVICNPEIKFGLFLDKTLKMGAVFVATGHYARLRREFPISNFQFPNKSQIQNSKKTYKLLSAKDKLKDQSYFLYRLNQKQLNKIIFPLGNLTKKQVYEKAKKMSLPYQSKQSFDICFIDDYREFLKRHLKAEPGKILMQDLLPARYAVDSVRQRKAGIKPAGVKSERVLGTHRGLVFYTIGQRANVGGPGPFYVAGKDIKKNVLYVTNKEKSLYSNKAIISDVNWLAGKSPKLPFRCKVKIRYQGQTVYCFLRPNKAVNKYLTVIFDKPQRAVTPGQSAVFYGKGGEILGGGIIKE